MRYRYTAGEKVVVWLDSFEELTYRQKEWLLNAFPIVELIGLFAQERGKVMEVLPSELYDKMLATLQSGAYLTELLEKLEKRKVFFVTCLSADYPERLKNLPAKPLILYGKGDRSLLKTDCFSIVGSRKILPRVKKLTEQTAATMSEFFTVVTGSAEGGDTAALRGVLDSGRKNVISIVAFGSDYIPHTGQEVLLEEVAKNGLLLSEYRPEVKPQKFLFPARNRIIAGLSKGVLVVGASKRSGTAITANYAMAYNRDVFAFPYNPGIAEGEGCNALIKQGAMLTDCAEDMLAAYGLCAAQEQEKEELSAEESAIMSILRAEGEMHVEKLAERLNAPAYALTGTLSVLEVKGLVVRSGGNRFTVIGK
jgi:DNA processing protein